jgi:2-polyprenyl-3-methyl-5-hydroxy-6-metoxy-1,4-benzoquinol methylase
MSIDEPDSSIEEPYSIEANGILVSGQPLEHRDGEYSSDLLQVVQRMQAEHFWYRGRARFILRCLKRFLRLDTHQRESGLRGVDLGGGCGGWIRYLKDHGPRQFAELALADSSLRALTLAADVVGSDVKRYQVDLLRLHWRRRWDVAFLLDVLEHIPDHVEVLRQIRAALRPRGLLLVTTPALDFFRTYNDDLIHHVRRYSRKDFARLATSSGLQLCFARYFMFFLSPLLLLSRLRPPDLTTMSEERIREHLMRSHRVPSWPVNQVLRLVFSLETPLGVWLPFPWGTSILAVLRKET